MENQEFQVLKKLIDDIYDFQLRVDNNYKTTNLKRINIVNFDLKEAISYRNYIRKNISKINTISQNFLENTTDKMRLENRVKNLDSMKYKSIKYTSKPEEGKISVNKCLNDIVGFRIIIDDSLYDDIIKYMQSLEKELNHKVRIRDASKGDYNAYHFYSYIDNYNFPIEVQFWNKKYEIQNKNSHSMYKQSYLDIETNKNIDKEERC